MRNAIYAAAVIMAIAICSTGCMEVRGSWQKEFGIPERALVPTGRNPYFILEPGFRLILESSTEKVWITVLDETKEVEGVITRVVEEREWKKGKLIEVSRNFFAIDPETGDAFYFGEDVDMYKDGKIKSHEGAWLAGRNGAKPGMIMPGKPRVGMKYYQELAPGAAMDRAEVISLDETLQTPAGAFTHCLRTKESSALNFFEKEYKTYAPGIGLIQDQKLLLTGYGFIEQE